jgi:hypothetical protein
VPRVWDVPAGLPRPVGALGHAEQVGHVPLGHPGSEAQLSDPVRWLTADFVLQITADLGYTHSARKKWTGEL